MTRQGGRRADSWYWEIGHRHPTSLWCWWQVPARGVTATGRGACRMRLQMICRQGLACFCEEDRSHAARRVVRWSRERRRHSIVLGSFPTGRTKDRQRWPMVRAASNRGFQRPSQATECPSSCSQFPNLTAQIGERGVGRGPDLSNRSGSGFSM
jgi:hypothetical protein